MVQKVPRWQRIALNAFKDMQEDIDFDVDVAKLKEYHENNNDQVFHQALLQIIFKYNAPKNIYSLLKRFVMFDEVDPGVIDAPIFLVSEVDKTVGPDEHPEWMMDVYNETIKDRKRVYLDLLGQVQREDIIDFVNEYYDSLIEPKLNRMSQMRPGAVRRKQFSKTHRKVIELHKDGISYRQIAIETNQSESNVAKILQRYKQRQKYDI